MATLKCRPWDKRSTSYMFVVEIFLVMVGCSSGECSSICGGIRLLAMTVGSTKKRQICARSQHSCSSCCIGGKKKLHENLTNTLAKLLKKLPKKIWFQRKICKARLLAVYQWEPLLVNVYCHREGGPSVTSHRRCIICVTNNCSPNYCTSS